MNFKIVFTLQTKQIIESVKMKISNFEPVEKKRVKVQENIYKYYFIANVTVVTGWFFFKKVEQKKVCLEPWSTNWKWLDSGEYTPNHDVEKLEFMFRVKKGKYNLEECI